jgi:choline-sulfatase
VRKSGQFETLVSDEVCRAARRAIYGRITLVDDHLQRIVSLLDMAGVLDDTFLTFLSDHGDMMGEHGLWYKNTAFEASSRVPLIFTGPGIQPGRLNETVSLLDLGPTIAGLAGIPALPVQSDGRDLSPLLRGERPPETGEAVFENYGEGLHRGVRTIVRWPFKLNACPGTPLELFHLETDQHEWTNVASEPKYQAAVAELLARLNAVSPEPDRYDELRWLSEERRLALLAAIPETERPRWRDDWRELSLRPDTRA